MRVHLHLGLIAQRHQGRQRLHYNVQNSISQCILWKRANISASKHAKSKIKKYLLLPAFIVIYSISKDLAGRGHPQRWHWSKDCKRQITMTETSHCQRDGANRLSCPFLQQHKRIKFRMSVCYNVQKSLYVSQSIWLYCCLVMQSQTSDHWHNVWSTLLLLTAQNQCHHLNNI